LTPEAQQRIFDPFFTTKTKGTGLGMAISRRLVEAHGGQLAIGVADRPQPYTGAEIIVILPQDERRSHERQGDERQGTLL
jgi:signal transduction histidine kinase